MARITITNPQPFKRIFRNPYDGRTARICQRCGAHLYGRNAGICRKCLTAHGRKEAAR